MKLPVLFHNAGFTDSDLKGDAEYQYTDPSNFRYSGTVPVTLRFVTMDDVAYHYSQLTSTTSKILGDTIVWNSGNLKFGLHWRF